MKAGRLCTSFAVFIGVLLFSFHADAKQLYMTEFQNLINKDQILVGSTETESSNTDQTTTDQTTTEQTTINPKTENITQTTTCILTKGMKDTYYLNMNGKVKWSVSNKKVAKLTKKSNKKCVIKGLKNGKTTITAKTDTQTLKIKVTVKSGNAFVNAWCKNWVKVNISKDMSKYDKMLLASYYMNVCYKYGSVSSVKDVIVKKKGNCVTGGRLLVKLLNNMGYKANLRFAAKDNMSRYPKGVYFASQHHNVKVKVKGKTYYVDGTPATGFIYLSTDKKPLYCAIIMKGELVPVVDKIN